MTVEELHARGHRNITATHSSTLEITKAENLTLNGHCVIAVSATKGPRDLSAKFRKMCANDTAKIIMEIRVAGINCTVTGRGSSALTLNHPYDIVTRKSSHISDRTLMIEADKAASDLKTKLVRALQSPAALVNIRLVVEN